MEWFEKQNKTARASLCVAQIVPIYLSSLQKQLLNFARETLESIRKQLICIAENYLYCLNQKNFAVFVQISACFQALPLFVSYIFEGNFSLILTLFLSLSLPLTTNWKYDQPHIHPNRRAHKHKKFKISILISDFHAMFVTVHLYLIVVSFAFILKNEE